MSGPSGCSKFSRSTSTVKSISIHRAYLSAPSLSTMAPLDPAKRAFIEAAIANNALLFGSFELKSGRISPYFFNAGNIYSASLIDAAATAYANILTSSRIPEFDVLFGPAYKGIPLAAVTVVALAREHKREVGFAYNRKEKKDHGEGGSLVGAPLKGRIVIIDDVITSGKAVREAIDIIASSPEAKLVGIVQLIDRQEKGRDSDTSAIQEVEKEFKVPVEPIMAVGDILSYLEEKGGMEKELEAVKVYHEKYGAVRQ
ncbi:phosphoribosyltransferase-like protein [Kockovaella imperatae]|uniref:orotate phosphoribosyltransferase n=1 Tax=Kockovaella imperatae TaxID=4999 RepID=A0A1Y1UN59_9TREE|nr:phosphoribosyltransferase-like protein [Kockovaella imperatae]ORX39442.1 phosphoribosyltransferase-like protein [Kockovaella imperatae]